MKDYYSSIHECPIYAWEKAKETGNTGFLIVANSHKSSRDIEQDFSLEGEEATMKLLDEIFSEFGFDKSMKKEVALKEKLLRARLEYLETGQRTKINEINIHQSNLNKIYQSNPQKGELLSFAKELGIVSKATGIAIDPKKTSVYQYNAYKMSINNG